ncbi:hypothetical protein H0H81_001011 [Sphagnurus paluster]|uniref:Uncharacterized protein n=1 Tax=Sphagnurus paluster TaxID=117069 RepID=A0A9P7FPR0_9AGAR|nr:hypothetical protein H0H81_001011 [Sphagnurus paluster]
MNQTFVRAQETRRFMLKDVASATRKPGDDGANMISFQVLSDKAQGKRRRSPSAELLLYPAVWVGVDGKAPDHPDRQHPYSSQERRPEARKNNHIEEETLVHSDHAQEVRATSKGGHPFEEEASAQPVTIVNEELMSLPFFTPALIVQALTEYLSLLFDPVLSMAFGMTSLPPLAVFSSGIRKEGQTWRSRTVPLVAPYSRQAMEDDWFFAFQYSISFSRGDDLYVFVKAKPRAVSESTQDTLHQAHSFERLLDLRGFLAEMESEGRPAAAPSAVIALEGVLKRLGNARRGGGELKLMNIEQAAEFCRNVEMWSLIKSRIMNY